MSGEEILSEEDKTFIKDKFGKEMKEVVPVELYVSDDCQYCDVIKQLLKTFVELSNGKINLEIKNVNEAKDILGVEKGPVIVIGKNREVRYTGAPLGEEGWAFIETIIMASSGNHGIDAHVDQLKSINREIHIETIVTPTCPYCPYAVLLANRVAIASGGKVVSDTIEAYEFPEIAEKWSVSAVPTVVLSVDKPYTGKVLQVGVPQEHDLIHAILEAGGVDASH